MVVILIAIITNLLSGDKDSASKPLSRWQWRRETSGGRAIGRRVIQLGLFTLEMKTRSARTPPRNQWEAIADLIFDHPGIAEAIKDSIISKQFERAFGRFNNRENQHNTYAEARKEGRNGYIDPNQGVTHAWSLDHEFGPRGIMGNVHHGRCVVCSKNLPAWRRCWSCIQMILFMEGEDILGICLRCTNKEHQMALRTDDLCDWHHERASLRLEDCPYK